MHLEKRDMHQIELSCKRKSNLFKEQKKLENIRGSILTRRLEEAD